MVKELWAAKVEIYFVPTTFQQFRKGGAPEVLKGEIATWGNDAQGMSIWQIQTSPIGGGLKLLEDQAAALHGAGKTWMSTVAMHYWCGSSQSVPNPWYWEPGKPVRVGRPNGIYFEHAGGKGLDLRWRWVINVQRPDGR